ncbi:nucleotidyltransferase family protein [Flagellimonas marinaquae]|uniref:nucleotidyltransferase family protein n=1 Tax=Flagellimonas marinaquae TaxID=254955 RepID=UPI0020759606|nr:nucleotidyltransferase family protein [Allomuricauda aquimarina]USD24958.1 nucleotidyltransferase family protein [Allomuricauda aquimarina]
MNLKLENEFIRIIESDKWMIETLTIVRELKLNDCWIGAGFVRNKIWDEKHGKDRTKLNDIDVIHFDKSNPTKHYDIQIETKLRKLNPKLNWSVKNQSRMHIRNGHERYKNCNEAISFWPETATAIAVRLNFKNKVEYIAPYGLEDLINLLVIPTPKFDLNIYKNRIEKKKWKEKWNKLKIKTGYNIGYK